jgi:hypothetical protein
VVTPVVGAGRVTHHNNWDNDEEFAHNKVWAWEAAVAQQYSDEKIN